MRQAQAKRMLRHNSKGRSTRNSKSSNLLRIQTNARDEIFLISRTGTEVRRLLERLSFRNNIYADASPSRRASVGRFQKRLFSPLDRSADGSFQKHPEPFC
jgi:hypothetical protein